MGSCALWRRCLRESLHWGELFKQSFSSLQPHALHSRHDLCPVLAEPSGGQRWWEHPPRWAQSSQAACPWALCASLCPVLMLAQTPAHTDCAASESHQLTLKLGLVSANIPRVGFSGSGVVLCGWTC